MNPTWRSLLVAAAQHHAATARGLALLAPRPLSVRGSTHWRTWGVTVYLRHCCGSDFSGGRRKVAAPTSASAHAGWFDAAVVADYYRRQSSGQPSHSVSARALIIAALLLAIATAGPPADAQQTPRLARIGLLFQATPTATAHLSEAFRQGM